MTPWLQDADVTLYHGDVLATLREMPAESVDCVVTSPPYWGLRDYGTGAWEGGDAGCDHVQTVQRPSEKSTLQDHGDDGRSPQLDALPGIPYRDVCRKCGATRIDKQLGLEPTPEEYVARMVEVFREVRRVLAGHGTVWLNLGDSYAGNNGFRPDAPSNKRRAESIGEMDGKLRVSARIAEGQPAGWRTLENTPGLKSKDLVGIPWRVAFALQADGWYLRSDIIWSKPNPMPESVTDRPTKAHEYVFLLSKQPRYYFDQEAVREAPAPYERKGGTAAWTAESGHTNGVGSSSFHQMSAVGRNVRSVWEIATQPYPEAHFATFPEELARRAIAAGCPEAVCRICGKARERVVERGGELVGTDRGGNYKGREADVDASGTNRFAMKNGEYRPGMSYERLEAGFTDCGHADYRPGIVLDPFIGSGTVAFVSRKLGRHAIGIDLNESYLQLAAKRLQQQSLFAEVASGT